MRLVCGNVHSVGFVEPKLLVLVERLGEIFTEAPPPGAPPEVLGPGTALADISTAAASTLAGRGMDSGEDRASLQDDLALAIEHLGPKVQEAAKLSLGEVRRQLPNLPALLAEVRGAEMLEGLATGVGSELGSGPVVLAAWADLLDAFFGNAPAAECELRILQLGELVDLRGAEWRFLGNTVREILWDDRRVLVSNGLIENTESDSKAANLSTEERLRHCSTLLGREPVRGDLTVWLGFADAELGAKQLSLGRVEFFDAQAGLEFIRSGGQHDDPELREEFEDDFLSEYVFGYIGGTEKPPAVLARAKLGEGQFGPSMRRARRLVEDLIRVAKPGTEWRMTSGSFAFVRGASTYWHGGAFETRKEPPRTQYHYESETADRLAALDISLVERLFTNEPPLHSAIGDIGWLERVMDINDQTQRVALGLRLIERLLPRAREEHWTLAVKRYIRDVWCQQQIYDFVIDVGYNAAWVVDFPAPTVITQEPWGPPRFSLHSYEAHDSTEHLRVIKALPELVDRIPPDQLQSRTVHELVARMESAESVLAWKGELAAVFDRLLARAGRQRNAILHGADTNERVVGSLEQFLGWLQNFLSQQALLAAERICPSLPSLRTSACGHDDPGKLWRRAGRRQSLCSIPRQSQAPFTPRFDQP